MNINKGLKKIIVLLIIVITMFATIQLGSFLSILLNDFILKSVFPLIIKYNDFILGSASVILGLIAYKTAKYIYYYENK